MSASIGLVIYGNEAIKYKIERRPRRKTLGIEVQPDLRVLVLAPTNCPLDVISAHVHRRARWIAQQLERFRRYSPRTPPRRYVAGETHLYLGRQYRLKYAWGERKEVRQTRSRLLIVAPVRVTPARAKKMLDAWYRLRAREIFSTALTEWFGPLSRRGLTQPRIEVRSMTRRWGSLSKRGSMTLNVNLIKAPRPCFEYVVAHELCHLVHDHHGAEFYRLLARLMPDWERRKRRLEEALL